MKSIAISIERDQRNYSWMQEGLMIWMGSVLIALCAPLSMKLPFTPVPVAVAPHLCIALGAILGRNRGALAVIAYLLQGAMGLPVFALGDSGIAHLLGPRGGYLFGYVAGAYGTGALLEKQENRTPCRTFLSLVVGNGLIYLFGVCQLALFAGFQGALLGGVVPFLGGDGFKLFTVYKALGWIRKKSSTETYKIGKRGI